jgi:hypothetical protein
MGSPIPRSDLSASGCPSTNRRQTGMMRAGFDPTRPISAYWTPPGSPPKPSRSNSIFLGDHHQRRLPGVDPLLDERQRSVQKTCSPSYNSAE